MENNTKEAIKQCQRHNINIEIELRAFDHGFVTEEYLLKKLLSLLDNQKRC